MASLGSASHAHRKTLFANVEPVFGTCVHSTGRRSAAGVARQHRVSGSEAWSLRRRQSKPTDIEKLGRPTKLCLGDPTTGLSVSQDERCRGGARLTAAVPPVNQRARERALARGGVVPLPYSEKSFACIPYVRAARHISGDLVQETMICAIPRAASSFHRRYPSPYPSSFGLFPPTL